MTASRLPAATRDAVAMRANGYCERCWRSLAVREYSFHHRRARKMGGTKDPLIHHPSNVVLICGSGTTGCHGQIENSRGMALRSGWLIPQYTNGQLTDPRECPMRPLYVGPHVMWVIPGPFRYFSLVERVAYEDE